MEKTSFKISSIHSQEFQEAVLREQREASGPLDIEEWLARKPAVVQPTIQDEACIRQANEEYRALYSAWLYSSPLPIELTFWNLLIEPRPPKQMTVGGLILAEEAVEAEKFKTNIGRIVHMGDAAFQSKTTGGIDLSKGRTPQVGEHIMHRHYSGLEIVMQNGRRFRIIDDTDVLGIVKNPDDWRMYL